MRKQLELWRDFSVVARFGKAWIIELNGDLHLSGGSKQEQAEAIEFASMFLSDRQLRIKLPPIKLRPIDEVRLKLGAERGFSVVFTAPRKASLDPKHPAKLFHRRAART